jgi:hypothetical protein
MREWAVSDFTSETAQMTLSQSFSCTAIHGDNTVLNQMMSPLWVAFFMDTDHSALLMMQALIVNSTLTIVLRPNPGNVW